MQNCNPGCYKFLPFSLTQEAPAWVMVSGPWEHAHNVENAAQSRASLQGKALIRINLLLEMSSYIQWCGGTIEVKIYIK